MHSAMHLHFITLSLINFTFTNLYLLYLLCLHLPPLHLLHIATSSTYNEVPFLCLAIGTALPLSTITSPHTTLQLPRPRPRPSPLPTV
ncbi:uncharacterized protein GGS22DRAFT_166346 [Annulohypoxylon maeteangense]|uniref:uncharacterized protein n=1 Tax=Annulohypoxylon maeteangense TaxID=1927788 RepID=UPI002007CEDD|nr:uncharacterized protein GGS22DRAFT_166346 [Annulohypoxylon maeteangense]KAI0883898.1 hypothetical protein GGS22DRAFT_166346 [Annulohypoxylon maeteangense]